MPSNKTSIRARDTRPPGGFPSSPAINKFLAGGNSEQGTVLTVTRAVIGAMNSCTVSFRGKALAATCAHPGIAVGDSVSMIEQPQGCFWATQQQPSWFRRPLAELIAQGKPVTAALEYLLQKAGKLWQPEVIITVNTGGWIATLETTADDLFPAYVYAIQTIDGVDYPSVVEADVPAPVREHVTGCYGASPVAFTTTTDGNTRTFTGDASATLKKLVIIPILLVIHYPSGSTGYYPPGSALPTDEYNNLDAATYGNSWTLTVDDGTPYRIAWGPVVDYEAITEPGDTRTLHLIRAYEYNAP